MMAQLPPELRLDDEEDILLSSRKFMGDEDNLENRPIRYKVYTNMSTISAGFRGVQWVQLHPPILRSTQFATIEFEFLAEFDREKIN